MRLVSRDAERRYAEVLDAATGLVVGADFDGTLSPIVEDPTAAQIHPDAPQVLVDLAREVLAVAVITGRPADQVVELGRLEEIADGFGEAGRLVVLGQYGNQRWDSTDRQVLSAEPPEALAEFADRVPQLVEAAGAADAWIEDKSLAIALHTRRLADPQAAYERLLPVVREAAEELGLGVEPGRNVVEVRAAGTHKGIAVQELREELGAEAFVFLGDDLGDLEAFRAIAALRQQKGMPALLVCSASTEQAALVELADIVVPGPEGVVQFLRQLVVHLGR